VLDCNLVLLAGISVLKVYATSSAHLDAHFIISLCRYAQDVYKERIEQMTQERPSTAVTAHAFSAENIPAIHPSVVGLAVYSNALRC
jgi:hypothetical protein